MYHGRKTLYCNCATKDIKICFPATTVPHTNTHYVRIFGHHREIVLMSTYSIIMWTLVLTKLYIHA